MSQEIIYEYNRIFSVVILWLHSFYRRVVFDFSKDLGQYTATQALQVMCLISWRNFNNIIIVFNMTWEIFDSIMMPTVHSRFMWVHERWLACSLIQFTLNIVLEPLIDSSFIIFNVIHKCILLGWTFLQRGSVLGHALCRHECWQITSSRRRLSLCFATFVSPLNVILKCRGPVTTFPYFSRDSRSPDQKGICG